MNPRALGLLLAGSIGCGPTDARHEQPQSIFRQVFDYPQAANFPAMQAEYSERLGPPVQHEKPSDAEAAERVVWQDSQTRFELTRDPKRSVSTVYGRLSDRP